MLNEVEDEKAYDTLPTDIINDILRSALPTYSMNQTEED